MPRVTQTAYPGITGAQATGTEFFPVEGFGDGSVSRTMNLVELWNFIVKNLAPSVWVAPTLMNGWSNYLTTEGANGNLAGYSRIAGTSELRLKGLVRGGTTGTVIFTLPVGFRPARSFTATVHTCDVATGAVTAIQLGIGADGTVTPYGTVRTFVALDLIVPLN